MLRKIYSLLALIAAEFFTVRRYPSEPKHLLDMKAYDEGTLANNAPNPHRPGTRQHWSFEVGRRDADDRSGFAM
jgi:hypothetical protein